MIAPARALLDVAIRAGGSIDDEDSPASRLKHPKLNQRRPKLDEKLLRPRDQARRRRRRLTASCGSRPSGSASCRSARRRSCGTWRTRRPWGRASAVTPILYSRLPGLDDSLWRSRGGVRLVRRLPRRRFQFIQMREHIRPAEHGQAKIPHQIEGASEGVWPPRRERPGPAGRDRHRNWPVRGGADHRLPTASVSRAE